MNKCQTSKKKEITKYILAISFKSIGLTIPFPVKLSKQTYKYNYHNNDDQKRFMTPKKAVKLGANYLVIGRPITKSSNPLNEINSINSSIE